MQQIHNLPDRTDAMANYCTTYLIVPIMICVSLLVIIKIRELYFWWKALRDSRNRSDCKPEVDDHI